VCSKSAATSISHNLKKRKETKVARQLSADNTIKDNPSSKGKRLLQFINGGGRQRGKSESEGKRDERRGGGAS